MKNPLRNNLVVFLVVFSFHATAAVHYVNVGNPTPVWPYTNWVSAATNIQDAVDAATVGETVLVTNGLYNSGGRAVYDVATNRVAVGQAIILRSVNGPGVTTIAGYASLATLKSIRCVYLTNGAALYGFTLANGGSLYPGDPIQEESGGGVWCEDNSVMVSNCVLAGNLALACGGGAFRGTLLNCVLTNNVGGFGAGACSNVLLNCTLIANTANQQLFNFGGGAFYCTLSNCLVVGNAAVNSGPSGGGAYGSTLLSCTVSNNVASGGSGGGVCWGTACNSLLASNRASNYGGGAYSNTLNNCVLRNNLVFGTGGGAYQGILNNCTVVSNTAKLYPGGGVAGATLNNCIVYYNVASQDTNFTSDCFLVNCDALPWATNGLGNLTNEPGFLNPTAGDFHLQTNSPMINAGNNTYVTNLTDFDGAPRIAGGTVDLGAYEVPSPASILSYAWAQQYGFATDGSADHADPDRDGCDNWQEWRAGTIPTNGASFLQLYSPARGNNPGGVTVSWQSVAGVNYFLQRATDLTRSPRFLTVQSNLVGQAEMTSYTDASATNAGPYFYRVGVP